jgi:hypothetical protein
MLGRCKVVTFPHKKYAALGIWALIHVLTGKEEEEQIHDPTLFGLPKN